jgi:AP-1 complex subunit beta-1
MSTYFKDQGKRGENAELQEELTSNDKSIKRDAVKKVIRDMTLGKDVSSLFSAVVNNMMTPNLEVRKLVYLYLINYAKTQPELTIMAVNGFVKDASDPNPLIRALAVRTMGCIRVKSISEYLCESLRRALKDSDPYVRKTAAICVVKLHEISPELVEDQGFIDTLESLLSDGNPMVVSNSVAALAEMSNRIHNKTLLQQERFATWSNVLKLLAVLNEASEWGQVYILDALAGYKPSSSTEAENILDRVRPRLQHANSAVVLSSTKVIMKCLDHLDDVEKIMAICKALGPPLVTLMSAEAEIQYVTLRNIQLICQKRPAVLHGEVKVFFCRYNDPIYVKMEKLDVLVMLISERTVDQVLAEFKEYASEIDWYPVYWLYWSKSTNTDAAHCCSEFVCKAVRCIGRTAIKLAQATERCVNVLVSLIETKVNYLVQEASIVIRDILRKSLRIRP